MYIFVNIKKQTINIKAQNIWEIIPASMLRSNAADNVLFFLYVYSEESFLFIAFCI